MSRITLADRLLAVPTAVREGLEWFHEHQGQEIPWPSPSPVRAMRHVVTSAKGIYKPAGVPFAFSVRQALNSPYADRSIIYRPSGGWVYAYHQEGADPSRRDTDYTNVALMQNISLAIPVAVLLQTRAIPPVRYQVVGLAMVTRWRAGYFYLEGFAEDGTAEMSGWASEDTVLESEAVGMLASEPEIGLDPDHDARIRVMASIIRRRGQGKFREALLEAYGGKCVVTGCEAVAALDAAHIQPYRGSHTDTVSNGLLLRTDLHSLFDVGQLAIDPVHRTVKVAVSLLGGFYGGLDGEAIAEPVVAGARPAEDTLRAHLDWCGDRLSWRSPD